MNPSTGTFISMDSYEGSIYDPITLHKYLYANANPVTYIDPSGYSSITKEDLTVAKAGMICIATAYLLYDNMLLNIFMGLRNGNDSVIDDGYQAISRELQDAILGFPMHRNNTWLIITIPLTMATFRLFEVIYAVEDVGISVISSKKDTRTAGEIIGQEKKGAINRAFPAEWRDATEQEIEDAAKKGDKSAQTAKKLLKDKRFDKKDNRK